MNYHELVQAYFERSVALQWYWTVYVLVIGGVVGFSTFRQRPELVTTILVTALYACFAYKNLGAIEETAAQREAIRTALKEYPTSVSPNDIKLARERIEPQIPAYDIAGARYFHLACDLLTVVFLWAKERRRRNPETPPATAAR
jgi:hypothetical protein